MPRNRSSGRRRPRTSSSPLQEISRRSPAQDTWHGRERRLGGPLDSTGRWDESACSDSAGARRGRHGDRFDTWLAAVEADTIEPLHRFAARRTPGAPTMSFALYAGIAVLAGILSRRLSAAVEPTGAPSPPTAPHQEQLRRRPAPGPVLRLAALFAVDAFRRPAGGASRPGPLAPAALRRLHDPVGPAVLRNKPAVGAQPGTASREHQHWLPRSPADAASCKPRSCPHFVSNLLLLAVPVSPSFGVTAVLLSLRHSLSKIDVPTRQAFTAAVVTPEQRTAAASEAGSGEAGMIESSSAAVMRRVRLLGRGHRRRVHRRWWRRGVWSGRAVRGSRRARCAAAGCGRG